MHHLRNDSRGRIMDMVSNPDPTQQTIMQKEEPMPMRMRIRITTTMKTRTMIFVFV